jgi:hypothetical protein
MKRLPIFVAVIQDSVSLHYLRAALFRTALIVILFVSGFEALSQFNGVSPFARRDYADTVWIVTGKRPLDALFQKQKLDFVLDARQTLISNKQARLAGLRVGVEYRRVHRFGFGFYGFGDGVQLNSLNELDTTIVDAVLNLSYVSAYYERVLFFNRKWEWSATVHVGRGEITGFYRRADESTFVVYPKQTVRPFELSTTGYYHLTWWCSLGVGVGYRFMRSTPDEIRPVYNAPVAIARVRIKMGKLVKSIWDKDAKNEY